MKQYRINSINIYSTTMGCYFVLINLLMCANVINAYGQQIVNTTEYKKDAYYHLQELQKGILLVVLQSDAKTEKALQDVMEGDQYSAKQKRKAAKRLKKTQRERKEFHTSLSEGFHQLYGFSDFRLIYDHDLGDFKDGVNGLMLNENLEKDESITIPANRPIYFAKEGYTSSTDGVRVLSYIVYDAHNVKLKPPFPSIKITDIGPVLLLRSLVESSVYRNGTQIVERFDYLLKHRLATLRNKLQTVEIE